MRRILFIAPQPFFQERGTPIAIRLGIEALKKNNKDIEIDLLTLGEGENIALPQGVKHYRCFHPNILRNIKPGISLKKVLVEFFVFYSALKLLIKNKYDLIHGVEEGGIAALILATIFRKRYVYDMDSSLVADVLREWKWLSPFVGVFKTIEAQTIRNAHGILTMCDSLAIRAKKSGGHNIHVVTDCSLIDEKQTNSKTDNLRELLKIPLSTPIFLYVGNLAKYQGIDLLLESIALSKQTDFHCVIIGGSTSDVETYKKKVASLQISSFVSLIGPRPISDIGGYLSQADVLLSPRCTEANTPMKIYSYLHAGKAILATNLSTHTQVLSPEWSYLTDPTQRDFSDGIKKFALDATLRESLGNAARKRAQEYHTPEVFERDFVKAYNAFLY